MPIRLISIPGLLKSVENALYFVFHPEACGIAKTIDHYQNGLVGHEKGVNHSLE
jgi:hypothetical protein